MEQCKGRFTSIGDALGVYLGRLGGMVLLLVEGLASFGL